jgi:hypothetical protein
MNSQWQMVIFLQKDIAEKQVIFDYFLEKTHIMEDMP